MTARPLGIYDICKAVIDILEVDGPDVPDVTGDHWYWCRFHERAERASTPVTPPIRPGEAGYRFSDKSGLGNTCVRVGPFMSKREAERLNVGFRRTESGAAVRKPALGMAVEE